MSYRLLFRPDYGEVAPEVEILPPQVMDLEHIDVWRARSNLESVSAMCAAYQKCSCYERVARVRTQDVFCDTATGRIRCRIYIPDEEGPHPVMMYYHGGSFSMNSIEVYEYVCRYMSQAGNLVIVSPDYHLAPEYKFPAGLEECYQVLCWTQQNIQFYQGDPENIHVCGDSSGGNFATVVAMMARDRKGPQIGKQILIYPVTLQTEEEMTESEKRYAKGYFLEYNCMEDPMKPYFHSKDEKSHPYASPLLAGDLAGLPEACILSAECDPLLDQGLMYAARLEDSGVKVEYHILKGMVHGFLNWTYGKSFEAMELAVEFVRRSGK